MKESIKYVGMNVHKETVTALRGQVLQREYKAPRHSVWKLPNWCGRFRASRRHKLTGSRLGVYEFLCKRVGLQLTEMRSPN